jgi:hypothetical protein
LGIVAEDVDGVDEEKLTETAAAGVGEGYENEGGIVGRSIFHDLVVGC